MINLLIFPYYIENSIKGVMSLDDEDLNFGVSLDHTDVYTNQKIPQNSTTLSSKTYTQPNANHSHGWAKVDDDFGVGKEDYDLDHAAHPTTCLATILFKGLAFFVYFFMGMLMSRVLVFIFVIILSSLDFWVVKNISGRLLVGLRWWSTYDQKGNEVWKFETYSQEFHANPVDKTFFWSGQIVGTLVWGIFLMINVLGLDLFDSLLLGINFLFCGTNLYGFYRCNQEYSKKVFDFKKKLGQRGLMTLANKFF